MPLVESLPVGADTAQWTVWGTVARLVVTRPERLRAARHLVEAQLAAIDAACSRFRDDSELSRLRGTVQVSALLADLVAAALEAARRSDGDVDPTVGGLLRRLGYDRDFASLTHSLATSYVPNPAPGWTSIRLQGRQLTIPEGTELDLGATAKAWTADRCAALVAAQLDTGVMIGLGGDLATAGPAPAGGWRILVLDRPGDPDCTVAIPGGAAMATSSTVSRTWAQGARHHIVDPATGLPARPVWRTVSVVAHTCIEANTLSTATVVRGRRALPWLRAHGVAARLVDAGGDVISLGGWPPAGGEQG
jgi:thiamine biosynthesis lipoprotein